MPNPTILEMAGAQPAKPPKYRPVSIKRWFTGLWTQRSPLMDPGSRAEERFYGGAPDTLIDGLNMELSNAGLWQRRPGWLPYTTATLDGPAQSFFSWRKLDGSVVVLAATGGSVYTLTPTTATKIFSKQSGAGQTFFCSVGDVLYFADGKDAKRWDGTNLYGWGLAAPANAPALTVAALSSPYPGWSASTYYSTSLLIEDQNGNLQKLTTGGTTGTAQPTWATAAGAATNDGSAVWTCQGSGAWAANHSYISGAYVVVEFTDTVAVQQYLAGQWQTTYYTTTYYDFFECTTAGTSGATAPAWNSGTNSTTSDGTAVWTCRGNRAQWTDIGASVAVTTTQIITDVNGNVQVIATSGKSGASAPPWATAAGSTTNDAGARWSNQGPLSISPSSSGDWFYAYAFKSADGHVGTASPLAGPIALPANSLIQVQGQGSADAQVSTIEIYRCVQQFNGATPGTLYLLGEVAAPAGGANGTWTYRDTTPDARLNNFIAASLAHANDPAPSGLTESAYHVGRMWGVSGNSVYFSGGPDTLNGNGNEAWPPANVFVFPGPVQRIVPQSSGMLVFTADALYAIRGADLTSFYAQLYQDDFGVRSPNAVSTMGSAIYAFTTDGQLCVIGPAGIREAGFAIGDLLEQFSPAAVYIAAHRAGTRDKALYICDGSTTIYRMNPTQPPEGNAAWSPKAQPIGGAEALAAIEVSPGVMRLLMSQPGSGVVLMRDLATFTDNGAVYPASLTVGSLVLAEPGQLAELESITIESQAVGTAPVIAVLLDEISGNFTTLGQSVGDPPLLPPSQSVYAQRFYLAQTSLPALCRHLQVQVSYAEEAQQNTLLSLSIFGGMK